MRYKPVLHQTGAGVLFTAHGRQTYCWLRLPTSGRERDHLKNLKNQALQGRLVDALAHRGDERRDTLR